MNHWDEIETARLVAYWMSGVALSDIAKEFGIGEDAVRKKISRLKSAGVPIPKRKTGKKTGMAAQRRSVVIQPSVVCL